MDPLCSRPMELFKDIPINRHYGVNTASRDPLPWLNFPSKANETGPSNTGRVCMQLLCFRYSSTGFVECTRNVMPFFKLGDNAGGSSCQTAWSFPWPEILSIPRHVSKLQAWTCQ